MSIFGKYDIRGFYPTELDEKRAKEIGYSLPSIVKSDKFVVGYDSRNSSPELLKGLSQGLNKRGVQVYNIGLCSTPQLSFSVVYHGFQGGVMVTASHNPKQYNGFRIVKDKARTIGSRGLNKICKRMGVKVEGGSKKAVDFDTDKDYKKFLEGLIGDLPKLKVVVDLSNGSAQKDLSVLEKYLGIIKINSTPNGKFPNHSPNPSKEENLSQLKKKVKKENAHFGVCFDGDGDRAVFVNEKGETVKGDYVMAYFIDELCGKGDRVIHDHRMSEVIEEICKKKGVKNVKSRIGWGYFLDEMNKRKYKIGGEISGHFYFNDNFNLDSGIVTLIKFLNLLYGKKEKVSTIFKRYERESISEEMNFEVSNGKKVFKRLKKFPGKKETLDGLTVKNKDYWFNARLSNTEPLLRVRVGGRTATIKKEVIKKIKTKIQKIY